MTLGLEKRNKTRSAEGRVSSPSRPSAKRVDSRPPRDLTEEKAAERRLQESQTLLAQAEQIANLGSWEFDVATRKVTWSEQLYHLFGLCPWEPAAEHIYWNNLHPGDQIRVRGITEEAIRECKEFTFVARYRLPTGEYRVHSTRGVPVRGVDGKTARVIGIIQDITDQAKVEADLHRLSRELMRARDEERRHMARELHESAGQSLAALKMTLGNLREALPQKNSLANSLLQACVDLTNEAVREVRTISYLMHPPMLDEAGLSSALRWYARGFAERSQIQVELDVPDQFGRQPQEIETTVFRIVQEALTNVHRYSGSKTACIRLWQNGAEICAQIEDRGCGLAHPLGDRGEPNGVGIAGMRERVHQLNGIFEIESVPGRGTTVRVVLPATIAKPAIAEHTADDLET
jgi:PAS domain S-box-containing protein